MRSTIVPRTAALALLAAVTLIALAPPPASAQSAEGGTPSPAPTSEASAVDPRFSSPRATMRTFLQAMNRAEGARAEEREAELRAAARCLEIPNITGAIGPDRAAMLKIVLDRIGTVFLSALPDENTVRQLNLSSYTFFPDPNNVRHESMRGIIGDELAIALSRGPNGEWRFSRQTVDDITGLFIRTRSERAAHEIASPLRTREMVLRSYIPSELQIGRFLSVEYWQWIGLFFVVFLGLLIDLITRAVLSAGWYRLARRENTDRSMLKRAVRPFGVLAAALFWYFSLPALYLPPTALQILLIAARVFATFAVIFAAFRLTDLLADSFMRRAERTSTKLDDLLVPLARRTVKILFIIVGVIYIADSFEVEILPLLTGLGIGGLAFAFAAKDTIENFFGSIAVIADRPFVAGDWVKINDVEGTVEELGLRSTRIRTFYNSLVTVPNATLVRATVDNYGRRRFRRYRTMINLTYDTPPDTIEAFCEGIREIIRQHPYTRKDYYHVWLNNFGAHSLDILVYMFHECPDWSTELRERHRFMLDVIRLADRLGADFAFPTQTLHLRRDDPDAERSPAAPPDKDTEALGRTSGRDAAREIMQRQHWRLRRPAPVRFDGKPDFGSAEDDGG